MDVNDQAHSCLAVGNGYRSVGHLDARTSSPLTASTLPSPAPPTATSPICCPCRGPRRWRSRRQPPEPPYLRDVAACEFAIAKVRAGAKSQQPEPRGEDAPRDGIRRHAGVALLHCAFDIRPIFEADSGQATPAKRDTPLAIAMPPDGLNPKAFEVLPVIYDILAAIDEWTDRSTLGATPEADRLIGDLAAHGLIEVRG
jgi:hypothetical protein